MYLTKILQRFRGRGKGRKIKGAQIPDRNRISVPELKGTKIKWIDFEFKNIFWSCLFISNTALTVADKHSNIWR